MTATTTTEPVLVYGATGVQGGAMLERLLGNGYAVRAQTSSEEHADALEDRGREVALATLDDPDALRTASEGAATVVLTLPQGYPSDAVRRFGRNAIDAAEAADVDLLVFNTSTRIPDEETGVAAFEDKRVLERYLADSDVPFVSLRPTLYMENFALPQGAQGLVEDDVIAYPTPPELQAAWISAEDLGAFVAETVAHPEWAEDEQRIDVGGPEVLDGAAIAECFAAALDRPVEYQQVPIDAFEAQLTETMGPEAGAMIPEMYRWAEANLDSGLFETDAAKLRRSFPDVELTPLKAWVEQQDWQQLAGTAQATENA